MSLDSYIGTNNQVLSSDIVTWASATNDVYRYRDGNSNYHYENVNDGNPNSFWISANNAPNEGDKEVIGLYFSEPKLIDGIGLKWPSTNVTIENVHLRRRGVWTFFYTNEVINNDIDAESIEYNEITPSFYIGDPQTDGQNLVPTEIYLKFFDRNIIITGLKVEITGLQVGIPYGVCLGEFIAYLENIPPEPEPEPESEPQPEPEPEPEPERKREG